MVDTPPEADDMTPASPVLPIEPQDAADTGVDGQVDGVVGEESWSASAGGEAGPEARSRSPRSGPRRARRTSRRGPRRGRRSLLVVVIVLGVPLVLLVLGGLWTYWQIDPPGSIGDPVEIAIEEGWGVRQIADHLDDQGVIGSSLAFQVYARATGSDDYQAGRYVLNEGMGLRDAANGLEQGPIIDYVDLPVIPGLWLDEIADRVDTLPGRTGERFLEISMSGAIRSRFQPETVDSLEGLLWPDTYRVSDNEDERDVLRTMVGIFDENADALGLDTAAVEGLTPYEILVVASLIQQEAGTEADRPLIASVIYNRLREGTLLQIDATVLYCIGERKTSNTAVDREVVCPHNTYLNAGLPPTPIGSLTTASLEAALNPADTPFRFYVLASDDGSHAFAETFEEHQVNVERARELGLLG